MGFKAIYDENVPIHLELAPKVTSARNLRSNNNEIIFSNQQLKSYKKQTRYIFNKLTTNIRSVEILSVFKTKVKNHLPDQALARKIKFMLKDYISLRLTKKYNKFFWKKNHVNMEVPINYI